MLKGARKNAWRALIAIVVVWFGYVALESTSVQNCIADKESKQAEEQSKENAPKFFHSFIMGTRLRTNCIGSLLYDNRDAVTAVATAFIAIFTLTLWWSTRGMLRVTNESIKLAKEEFISTNRPRVILRIIHFSYPEDRTQDVPIMCIFVNIGRTDAEIIELDIEFVHRPNRQFRPVPRQASAGTPLKGGGRTMKSGETFSREIQSGLKESEIALIAGQPLYYVRGAMTYLDKGGVRRSIGFCRDYDPHDRTFHKTDMARDLGYEYED
jgi:hypothetical protein